MAYFHLVEPAQRTRLCKVIGKTQIELAAQLNVPPHDRIEVGDGGAGHPGPVAILMEQGD
jgi:hypothetical protein